MHIERLYTKNGQDPYKGIKWEHRTSKLVSATGDILFQMDDIIVPSFWSKISSDILAQKYFCKAVSENDARQVFHRLSYTWTEWGKKYAYFDTDEDAKAYYDEMCNILAFQRAAPNSPQWYNTGLSEVYNIKSNSKTLYYVDDNTGKLEESFDAYKRPQAHACFILGIEDKLLGKNGIMDLVNREAELFKYGAGSGTNFSCLRSEGEKLSGGGVSSGLLSFLKLSDRSAAAIKSGGNTRRAAKMDILDIDHPDIEDFIKWKPQEELKAASLITGSKIIHDDFVAIRASIQKYLEEITSDDGIDVSKDNCYLPSKNRYLKAEIKKAISDGIPSSLIYKLVTMALNPNFKIPVFNSSYEGDVYSTVSGQSSNNSVRIPNKFMEFVESQTKNELENEHEWELVSRTTGTPIRTIKVSKLWDEIAECAWNCADPGVQFSTTINDWNTCPNSGQIKASNPCSEYFFLDNTACNLASIKLTAYYQNETGQFDVASFKRDIDLLVLTLDITNSMAQFSTKELAENTWKFRTIGLGFADLGSLLMMQALPYNSDKGRAMAATIAAILGGEAYLYSSKIAKQKGAFPEFSQNREEMLSVIWNHRNAAFSGKKSDFKKLQICPCVLDEKNVPNYLLKEARDTWDKAYESGKEFGYRNAQTSAIAPTGTIGLLMGCSTTGIEPDFALVKWKNLSGGGSFKIVNNAIEPALLRLGYSKEQITQINNYILETRGIAGAPFVKEEDFAVFETASPSGKGKELLADAHILMLASVQPYISGGISKTVNFPISATKDDIKNAFILAWKNSVKSLAIYRDSSKLSQSLVTSDGNDAASESKENKLYSELSTLFVEKMTRTEVEQKTNNQNNCKRTDLPNRRNGYTQKARIGGHSLFLRTGEYDDGSLGEIFLDMHKEGAAFRSLLNSFAIAVSLGLQYGVPLDEYVDAFTFSRFEPNGMVQGHDYIKMSTSVLDYVFRDLAINYLKRYDLGQIKPEDLNATNTQNKKENLTQAQDYENSENKEADENSGNILQEVKMNSAAIKFNEELNTKIAIAKERGYEGDPCPICGHMTLVRNGTCLKCDTCGSTTGCS